ncbi:MAG TPA: class I SAM-dependent methyltransferase, partial [Kofleriaceae bacterium]|nr:class I SAM-dependent methyltransferase [Kofleriaceae bacterium]
LGAGSGRLAVPLARGGLRVTALDRSPPMLTRGRAAAAAAGVDVEWVEADMTAFDLGRRFEAVLLAFNTLLHLHTRPKQEALFAAVHRHLAPGGLFALSIVSPDPATLARAPDHRLLVTDGPVDDPVEGAPLTAEETIHYDHATQCNLGVFRFSYPGRPDAVVVPVDLRMIYPAELEALLHYNGFELVARHGDWDGSWFTSASLHQHVICRARRAG